MSVLSDITIKKRLSILVPNGETENVSHCSYEFTASKVFKGAAPKPSVVSDDAPVVVEPTELVWIRAKEEINVPGNCVGMWVPTQTLSRQGLLLLNQTLVEPGYCGPLHAVFVNFGRTKVVISHLTKIAKVVLFELDKEANQLVKFETANYDSSILGISSNAPDSFMQLSSLVPSLKTEFDALVCQLETNAHSLEADIAGRAAVALNEELRKCRDQIRSEVDRQKEDMTDRIKQVALRWGGATVGGLILGVAVIWLGFSVYLPRIAASYADIDGIARKAVQERSSALDAASAEVRNNRAEIDALRQELQAIKSENANRRQSRPPSGPAGR